MSLFVIYFGTKRQYRDAGLAHHNIMMNQRYKGLLRGIFGNGRLPQDFSLYLHMPSLTDPSLAPEGGETFYVLSPVPHLGADIDWALQAQPYRDAIMAFLEQNYLPDLRANIVAEHRIDSSPFRGHAQQLSRLRFLHPTDPHPERLVPPPQPFGRCGQSLLCRRRHPSRRRRAGRALLRQDRGQSDRRRPACRHRRSRSPARTPPFTYRAGSVHSYSPFRAL